jgi:hypothetical protein
MTSGGRDREVGCKVNGHFTGKRSRHGVREDETTYFIGLSRNMSWFGVVRVDVELDLLNWAFSLTFSRRIFEIVELNSTFLPLN